MYSHGRELSWALSTEGLGILDWPAFRDNIEISNQRPMSEHTSHNNRTISTAMGVSSVLCNGLELVWKGSRITGASRWDWSLLTDVCSLELLRRVRSESSIGKRGESLFLSWWFVIGCMAILSRPEKSQEPVSSRSSFCAFLSKKGEVQLQIMPCKWLTNSWPVRKGSSLWGQWFMLSHPAQLYLMTSQDTPGLVLSGNTQVCRAVCRSFAVSDFAE